MSGVTSPKSNRAYCAQEMVLWMITFSIGIPGFAPTKPFRVSSHPGWKPRDEGEPYKESSEVVVWGNLWLFDTLLHLLLGEKSILWVLFSVVAITPEHWCGVYVARVPVNVPSPVPGSVGCCSKTRHLFLVNRRPKRDHTMGLLPVLL